MRMILRLDADFSGMPGGIKAEQLAMGTLYERLRECAEAFLPEYASSSLSLIVGYEDTPQQAQGLMAERWVAR